MCCDTETAVRWDGETEQKEKTVTELVDGDNKNGNACIDLGF